MNEGNTTSTEVVETSQSYAVAALLIVEIPAIVCSLLLLAYFFTHWKSAVVNVLRHHAIFLLTIVSFLYIILDLPFTINSLCLGYDSPRTASFCLWWYWLDYTILCMSLALTATASLQRHFLIFHSNSLRIRWLRWLVHSVPLIVSTIYPGLFYLGVMFIFPCQNVFDQNSFVCPSPCYTNNEILNNVDWILNTISPVIIILLANISLFIRVIRSMKRIRRTHQFTWKRQKKLSLQLFAFTSLYVVVWVPTTFIGILQSLVLPDLLIDFPSLNYVYYLIYFVCPLQVFIYLLTWPELIRCIKMKIRLLKRKTRILPILPA